MSLRARAGAAAGLALLLCAWSGAWAQGAAATPPAPPAAQQTPNADQPQPAAADGKAAEDKPREQQEQRVILPNVNVQGQRNVFNDNDKKLKELQESLPCTGCDAKPHTKKKLVKRVLDAVGDRVLPTEAPDHSDRDPNDKAQELSKENLCSAGNMNGCVQDNLKP
jgi:hypothetical protein